MNSVQNNSRLVIFLAAAFSFAGGAFAGSAQAEPSIEQIELRDGSVVSYAVVVPQGYDGTTPVPAILALPSSSQTMRWVNWGMRHYWQDEAERRGMIVISPAVTGAKLFYEGGEKILPEFLSRMRVAYQVKDDKFHLVGISNGGISAFAAGASYPAYFSSILALNGYIWAPTDAKYAALKDICTVQIVGQNDYIWVDKAKADQDALAAIGKTSVLKIVPGSPLRDSLFADDRAAALFDMIEQKEGC